MVSSERRTSLSSSMASTASTAMASSSYSSSSSASPTSVSVDRFDSAADRMVKEELEAAEALADLAHLAMRESSGAESPGNWGLKGKRAKKRVKSQSPPSQSGLNPVDPAPACPDLSQDQAIGLQQCEPVYTDVHLEPVKTEHLNKKVVKNEHDAELTKLSPICTTSYASFSCSKSRRNLTEEEKEERRVRRILANRESARQTIRRRQALCEELTKKAADLALENENLKMKKEVALKDYQSLEKTNKNLKVEMAKMIKQETRGENMSAYVHMQIPPSSPTNSPVFLFNRPPFTPLYWPPPIIQSPNSIQFQHVSQTPMAIPSIPFPANGTTDSFHEQENPLSIDAARTPLYVFPCPWFIPHFDNGTGLQPQTSLCLNNKQEETSSSRTVAQLENQHSSFPTRLKTEASSSMEPRLSNDLNETPAQPKETSPPELSLAPASLTRVASSIKHENGFESDYAATTEKSYTFSSAAEKNSEPIMYPNRKLADAVAAAEARKRRKNLTKLKNLHGRQCRMHC